MKLAGREADPIIVRILEDIGIKRNSSDLRRVLKEVAVCLDRMQGSDTNISEACELWLALERNPIIVEHDDALASVQRRSAVVLSSGSFFAANIVDPRFRGQRLSPAQLGRGLKFLPRLFFFFCQKKPA